MKRCPYCFKPLSENEECDCNYLTSENAQNEDALQPGTIIGNDYIIGAVLGQGGFGITYKGFDKKLKIIVAIKEFFPKNLVTRQDVITTDGVRRRTNSVRTLNTKKLKIYLKSKDKFYTEAQSLAKLRDYPNVVHVYRFFEENETVYFVMNYIHGKSLYEILKEKGKLSEKELIPLLDPILEALENIHNEKMLHRDIAPDNIIIEEETNQPILIDFGAVKIAGDENDIDNRNDSNSEGSSSDGKRSFPGSSLIVEKKGFTPLEQIGGNPSIRSDIYAMGATYYNMLSGKVPPESYLRAAKKDPVIPLKNFGVSQQVSDAVMKAMAFNKENRWKSIAEFRAALPGKQVSKWRKRLPLLLGFIVIIGSAVFFVPRLITLPPLLPTPTEIIEPTETFTPEIEESSEPLPIVVTVLTETNTPEPTESIIIADTNTPLPTDTPIPSGTNTPLPSDTSAPTSTNTPLPSDTPVPTSTNTPLPSDTLVPTDTITPLPSDTLVPTDTITPLPSNTPIPTNTNTPLPSDTLIPTNTNTPLPSDTLIPTNTNTPLPSDTLIPTNTNTPLPSDTLIPTNTNTPLPTNTANPDIIPVSGSDIYLHEGDVIQFGRYEQDNDLTNDMEAIEWIVLDIDSKLQKALVISKKALDLVPHNQDYKSSITWDETTLRNWLNTIFYENNFTTGERSRVLRTEIKTFDEEKNINRVSADQIFLLSKDEVTQYFPEITDRICDLTDYANSKRAVRESHAMWWMRKSGKGGGAIIDYNGNDIFVPIYADYAGVRPAFWLSLAPGAEDISPIPTAAAELTPTAEKEIIPDEPAEMLDWANVSVGDTVTFGHYEQDIDSGNGKELVEWIVLEFRENDALLISRYALDTMAWTNDTGEGRAYTFYEWLDSNLKNWLNSEFLNEIFSPEEQQQMTANGDRLMVSLLTKNQVEKYFPNPSERICTYTRYAGAQGAWKGSYNALWWLRDYETKTNMSGLRPFYVDQNGTINSYYANTSYITVRPVICLKLSK